METQKLFYIGERINPQFAKSYYIAYGQLTKKEALKKEDCIYGEIYLTGYNTKAEYNAERKNYAMMGLVLLTMRKLIDIKAT